MSTPDFKDRIFCVSSLEEFKNIALDIFRYQSVHIPVYKQYLDFCHTDPQQISEINSIPFLPIHLFKTQKIISENTTIETVFKSSGTSDAWKSCHYISDLSLYKKSFLLGFEKAYGATSDYCILALLPSYIERPDSSLIYMVQGLMTESKNHQNCFYLNNHTELFKKLNILRHSRTKTILWGVSFALLDFAREYKLYFPDLIIMETGGMKGREKEIVREELHEILKRQFSVPAIHSEYGMTELLSQAYSKGEGLFHCPPWMKIYNRDIHDPRLLLENSNKGCLNIIDLANYNSCAFIASDDYGIVHKDGSFEMSGRMDNSEIRGCNLMIQ